jgi:hypothetical protein
MENVMYQILSLVFMILGLVLTYFVVPWLKSKFSNEQLLNLGKWAKIAVTAAEQMKATGLITEDKKTYVVQFLKDKGITITDQELDALIEAAVFEIDKTKNLLLKDLDLQGEVLSTESESN